MSTLSDPSKNSTNSSPSSRSDCSYITQSRLKDLLSYNPETGLFTWRPDCGIKKMAGKPAGTTHPTGYRHILADGVSYRAHRLAWLYVHGMDPPHDIDHINSMKADNRIINLRLATRGQGQANKKRGICNTSGFKGVSKEHRANRWRAQISHEGMKRYLGSFRTPKEAHAAYCTAADKYHKEFANYG